MALSRVKYIVNNLMSMRRVARESYLVSGHNLVTSYIMVLNHDRTHSVRLKIWITTTFALVVDEFDIKFNSI